MIRYTRSPRIVIIGAGIVGLATAHEILKRNPSVRLTVLEKETEVARHQTSHNSGVLHSGIYYKPGSLKARLCREGRGEMARFCKDHGIPIEFPGKMIVATTAEEVPRLEMLHRRGMENGIPRLRKITADEIRAIEPHAFGVSGLYLPDVAVTDFQQVARCLAIQIEQRGGKIECGAGVLFIETRDSELVIETARNQFIADYAINCAGLESDRVASMAGADDDVRIAPFRGEYYEVVPEKQNLVRGLIYPVPDPDLPFLGVHFTRRVDGSVEAGPNAVFALAREGYKATDINLRDLGSALCFPGFWKMAARNWKSAAGEYHRSFSKRAFVAALQRLVPELKASDLKRGGAGVRAQALTRDGALVDDFRFGTTSMMTHVYNVPSPAATASLAIARELVDRVFGSVLQA